MHSVFFVYPLQQSSVPNTKIFRRQACTINPLPNTKIESGNFADDKIYVNENLKFVLGRVENIVGKGENAGYHFFLLCPIMFSKGSFFRVVGKVNLSHDINFASSKLKA